MEKEESTKPYVYYERILNGIVEIPKTIQDKMANIILIKNQKKMEEQQKENQPSLFDSKQEDKSGPEENSGPEEKPGFFDSIFPKEEKPGFFDNLFPKKTEPEEPRLEEPRLEEPRLEEPGMFDSLLTKTPVQEKKTDLFDNLFSSPKTNTKCKIRDW